MKENTSEDMNCEDSRSYGPYTRSRSLKDRKWEVYVKTLSHESVSSTSLDTVFAPQLPSKKPRYSSNVTIISPIMLGKRIKLKVSNPSDSFLGSAKESSRSNAEVLGGESKKKDSEKLDPFFRDNTYFLELIDVAEQYNLEENYFHRLPIAVIEQILHVIPFPDFMKMRLVCKSWDAIVSNNKYMEWKKAYYQFKQDRGRDPCFKKALEEMELTDEKHCFLDLLRYMAEKFRQKPASDMMENLAHHHNYKKACVALLDQFTEWKENTLSPWSVATMLVILSETVGDIGDLFHCLLSNKSKSSFLEIHNFMYCVATFLLYFHLAFLINHGIHHRLYSTLYMFENSTPWEMEPSATSTLGYSNNTLGKHKLTYEQIKILKHQLEPNQRVQILGFASTGKTTTLIHFAKLYPNLKFLYVGLNKSVCEQARLVFPKNVICHTAHFLAYRSIGYKYRQKLSLEPHLKPLDIMTYYLHFEWHVFPIAKYIVDTIECFMASCDEWLMMSHVPEFFSTRFHIYLSKLERHHIFEMARSIWLMMSDIGNTKVKIVPGAILKIYHLSKPELDDYDCMMVDDAENFNMALLDILMSQNKPVIVVGDPNQYIDNFNGAKNPLLGFQATHTYKLTKSFRFGSEIAYVASCCLEIPKFIISDTLVGTNNICHIDGILKGQCAIIARTNVELFQEAIRLCCTHRRYNFEPEQIVGSFAGGIDSYKLNQILDIRLLYVGKNSQIRDNFVKRFSSFWDLKTYVILANDTDLESKIMLVLRYGKNISSYIETVMKKCSHAIELSNIVFSTVPKAKGLQFETVRLINDYCSWSLNDESVQQCHLLYVAVTRAKRSVFMSKELAEKLQYGGEFFQYLESQMPARSPECRRCKTRFFPETSFTCCQKSIVWADGSSCSEGPVCPECVVKNSPSFLNELPSKQRPNQGILIFVRK